jgi:CRISPR system Cascade subunit CasD
LALGRKSYVPSEPVWIDGGVVDTPLIDVLAVWPWISSTRRFESGPERLLVSLESNDESGALRMDQLLSSFAERRFGARYVRSDWVNLQREVVHAPS